MQTYAHSRNPSGTRHPLVDHLKAVSRLAAEFATPLGAAELGRWVGLWHDVGKFHPRFQPYLEQCDRPDGGPPRGPDHKGAGALLAFEHLEPIALLVQGRSRPVKWCKSASSC